MLAGTDASQQPPLEDQHQETERGAGGEGHQRNAPQQQFLPRSDRFHHGNELQPEQGRHGGGGGKREAQQLPKDAVTVTDEGWVVSEAPIDSYDSPHGELEGWVAEPGSPRVDDSVVGDGANREQNVLRERLAGRDHGVVAEESVLRNAGAGERDGSAVDARAGQIDAVGEETFGADLDQFRNGVEDGRDLASGPDAHAGEAQPHRPEERAAEPFTGGDEDAGLEPDADIR